MIRKTYLMGAGLLGISLLLPHAANAYGVQGLFGGRALPSGRIMLENPLATDIDRPDRAQSVLDYPRPEYDPVPVEYGSFIFFPSLEIAESYDSNVYAASSGEVDDLIHNVRPSLNVQSDWGRHAISFTTFGDLSYYTDNTDENTNNFVANLNGRYDFGARTALYANTSYQHLHESRSSPDAVDGTEPTAYTLMTAGLKFDRSAGLLGYNFGYDMSRYDYENTPTTTGSIDQSSRNHYEHVVSASLSYDENPNLRPYLKTSYNVRTYDNNAQDQSDGYDVVAGTAFDMGGITSLDVYAGWMTQYYDGASTNRHVEAPKFGALINWNVTGLTSVIMDAERVIQDSGSSSYNAYVQTGGSLTVTHELMRNVLVETDFSYTNNDFKGTSGREDDQISAGLGARYLINRNFYLDCNYTWSDRDSNDDTKDYERNLVTMRLGMRL